MTIRQTFLAAITLSTAFGCSMSHSASSQPSGKTFAVTSFGALGDGTTMNTPAIQAAIDKAAMSGGGTVVVPKGTFLSGAIFLKPTVNLYLDAGAVIKGSTNVEDYPKRMTRIEGHFEPWLPALVNAQEVDHLRISGEGMLEGGGKFFWTAFRDARRARSGATNLSVPRPRMLFVENSKDVRITGIRLKDSGFWNLHLYRCDDVMVDGVDIRSIGTPPDGAPSTDGIDIDSSRNVTIKNTYISVGDDCIALKGSKGPFAMKDEKSPPVEHIRITDCTFGGGGGITCGSEATIVRDVIVDGCTFAGAGTRSINLVRLKLRPDTPQLYEDIHFKNITLDGGGRLFSVEPWRQYFDLMGQPRPTRTVRNISVSNVKGSFGGFGVIQPNVDDTVENIVLENIDVTLTNANARIVGVKNLKINNVNVNGAPLRYSTTQATQPTTQERGER